MYVGEIAVEITTEADSNDIIEYPHDDKPTTGMFVIYGAIISAFIFPCLTCLMFALIFYY